MPHSLDSARPILSRDPTNRFSTYTASTMSSVPSVAPSFSEIDDGLRRLDEDKSARRLQSQRFEPSDAKTEVLAKLALGAKLERALKRRMDGQDYVPRVPVKSG